jgi:hypothetical protein
MKKKPRLPTQPESWPGDESFDDLDADEFTDDDHSTDDLPCVEPRQSRRSRKGASAKTNTD